MSMSLLSAHLEQITASCEGIESLSFPRPRIFTNALLATNDITSLIRDTEAHERALFSVPPPPPQQQQQQQQKQQNAVSEEDGGGGGGGKMKRRQTVFNVAAGEVTTGPPPGHRTAASARRNTAVAAVLGGDLHGQIMRGGSRRGGGGEVDIEVLLRGAEKLCNVYPLPGALERIPALRQKYAHQCNTLAYYEARVAEQASRLERMNKDRYVRDGEGQYDDDDDDDDDAGGNAGDGLAEEDLRREEEEVRELDRKKKELQERLRAMDKDLGGLLNM